MLRPDSRLSQEREAAGTKKKDFFTRMKERAAKRHSNFETKRLNSLETKPSLTSSSPDQEVGFILFLN